MKIVAVGDAVTVQALKLMGIAGTVARDRAEAEAALDEAATAGTVVLVAEPVANLARARVDALKVARADYIVLEIPSPAGVPHQAEETARLVSQTIGVKV